MAGQDCTISESTFKLPDSYEVYTKTVRPTGPPQARLIFVHGFSDHSNLDEWFLPYLASKGIEVFAFDQRGWGRSVHNPSERGNTGPTEQVMADLTAFVKHVLDENDKAATKTPVFLMGHSMGGQEVLYLSAKASKDVLSRLRGLLIEAPWTALSPQTRPWQTTVWAGRMASKALPTFHLVNKLKPEYLARDPAVGKKFKDDPLCHETATLQALSGMLDRGAELADGVIKVPEGVNEGGKTRLWVGHGTKDMICDFDACERMFERFEVKDKTFKRYEGWYHVLHAEKGDDKKVFADDVVGWILQRAGSL